MKGKQNPHFLVANRRLRVSEMYLQMYTQQQIADSLNVSQPTIAKDIKTIKEDWKNRSIECVSEIINEKIQSINELKRQAWIGWRKSIENIEIKKGRVKDVGNKKISQVESVSRGQTGNPAFLETVLKCELEEIKLRGLFSKNENNNTPTIDVNAILERFGFS